MPNMTPEDISMIGGGDKTGGSPPITVTGVPPTGGGGSPPITVTGVPPTGGGGSPPITVTGVPPTGGGGSPPPPPPPPPPAPHSRKVADYTIRCTSANGSAVDIANKIKTISTPEGADWTQVEFDAIVLSDGGSYGALNNAIYSNNQQNFATIPKPPSNGEGLVHNHVLRGDEQQQNIDKYPSDQNSGGTDWETLQQISQDLDNKDPSLWILGPDGVVREFKLSERATYQALTHEQLAAGVGLEGKDRNQTCS